MRTIFLAILVACLPGALVCADDKPLLMEQKDSGSPNKRYYVALIQEIPDDGADCTLQIRSCKDKKVLATFDWAQFWDHLSSDCPVKWTENSKMFSITGFFGRGWTGSRVFFHTPNDTWSEVDIPLPDTGHSSKNGWETKDKGGYSAVRWLANKVLVMDYVNPTCRVRNAAAEAATNDASDREWAPSHYLISLRMILDSGGHPVFKQIDLKVLPDVE